MTWPQTKHCQTHDKATIIIHMTPQCLIIKANYMLLSVIDKDKLVFTIVTGDILSVLAAMYGDVYS